MIGRLPDRLFQSMLTDYENEQNELNKIIETDTADTVSYTHLDVYKRQLTERIRELRQTRERRELMA